MIKLKCQNKFCNYIWDYSGTKVKFYTNCPQCMAKVNLEKHRQKEEKQE
jgi:hypothetical protein